MKEVNRVALEINDNNPSAGDLNCAESALPISTNRLH